VTSNSYAMEIYSIINLIILARYYKCDLIIQSDVGFSWIVKTCLKKATRIGWVMGDLNRVG
jgi:hypothetical protein